MNDRPIRLADASPFEQRAELLQGLAVAAEYEATRRIAVEPVRQRRHARQAEPQAVEMRLEAVAALGPWMDREPDRLVEHQHQGVAVEKPGRKVYSGHRTGCIGDAGS